MASDNSIGRDPEWVTEHASGIACTASQQDAVHNSPVQGRGSPIRPIEPWRESQWRQVIEEIVGGIACLPHLRRHQRTLVGLPAACRSYYQKVMEILDLMYKSLEIGNQHGDHNQHSSGPHIIEDLRWSENPLVSILGRGEEHQFLRDSRSFCNSPRYYASSSTDISLLQQFCDGNIPERLESALGVAIDCIKVDAECRHTGAEPLAVQNPEAVSSEVCGQMLYFHYCRKSSLQARQESRTEELEATVNNRLTVQEDLCAQDARLLDSLYGAERRADTAESELEAERILRQQTEVTVNNMLTVEDDLRAQTARLLDSLRTAEQHAASAENELDAERTLRQHAEASSERTARQTEDQLRDEYVRQHDEWCHHLRNYRADRQYGPAFQDSVEAPGRASGDDLSWLYLRREVNELFTDLNMANDAQANLEADLSTVRRQHNHLLRERNNLQGRLHHALRARDNLQGQLQDALRENHNLQGQFQHALRERDHLQGQLQHALRESANLQGQLQHAQAYYPPHYQQRGWLYPR